VDNSLSRASFYTNYAQLAYSINDPRASCCRWQAAY